jgi:hypothetical protein
MTADRPNCGPCPITQPVSNTRVWSSIPLGGEWTVNGAPTTGAEVKARYQGVRALDHYYPAAASWLHPVHILRGARYLTYNRWRRSWEGRACKCHPPRC